MGVGGSDREVATEKDGGERLGFGRIRGAQQLERLRGFACLWSKSTRPALFMSGRDAE